MSDTAASATAASVVELTAADLVGPGVIACPHPRMPLWSNHPKVFIDVHTIGKGRCPYCGTTFRLADGEKRPGAH